MRGMALDHITLFRWRFSSDSDFARADMSCEAIFDQSTLANAIIAMVDRARQRVLFGIREKCHSFSDLIVHSLT
jgi:hypothetical protein